MSISFAPDLGDAVREAAERGALIAIDRKDRQVHTWLRAARRNGEPVRTNAMALAQA